jgi:cytidine deaminase
LSIEESLYQSAIELIGKRYPSGWGGAAAMYTEDGQILTSVSPEIINASTELCIETGAILEAHKLNAKVTHTICVVREDVKAAVINPNGELEYKMLKEIQPYHWYKVYENN